MVEVSGYSFVGEDTLTKLGVNDDTELRMRNPISKEQDRLRKSLVPNVVNTVMLNSRHSDEFHLYELARVYIKKDRRSAELAMEKTMVTGAVYRKKPDSPLFYEAKRIVQGLMKKIQIADWSLVPEEKALPPYAHPGRSMTLLIEKKIAGYIFEIHPETARTFDIAGSAALFDIDLNVLYDARKSDTVFTELQKYPEVPFEVSVLADRNVYARDICSIIEKAGIEMLQGVEVVSVYEGSPIPEGKKSVSIKVVFASKDRTLTSEEIDRLQKSAINLLNKKGYQLR